VSKLALPVGPRDHIAGNPDARVTLVEYLDYECPYCARANGVVSEILRAAGDVVRYVVRHFPLSQIHPHALVAAQAAEAAAEQGRFWPMHATLFQNQDALELEALVVYAEALGLDTARFADDVVDGVYLPKVRDDFRSGIRSGVNGTPTFFVNGIRHDRGWDSSSLVAAIREADRTEQRVSR
jgi:protein-disulfide isomerase